MVFEEITPTNVAPTVGNYAAAVSVPQPKRMLFISGQIPTLEDGAVPQNFAAQAEAVWENIGKTLKAAGMGYTNLAKVNTYLTDCSQADLNGEIRRKFLGSHRPALTVVVVQTLDPVWLLEIEALAVG